MEKVATIIIIIFSSMKALLILILSLGMVAALKHTHQNPFHFDTDRWLVSKVTWPLLIAILPPLLALL